MKTVKTEAEKLRDKKNRELNDKKRELELKKLELECIKLHEESKPKMIIQSELQHYEFKKDYSLHWLLAANFVLQIALFFFR